jgi:hypothetical protein
MVVWTSEAVNRGGGGSSWYGAFNERRMRLSVSGGIIIMM